MKPLLPQYKKLKPYLERIDENRFYSNGGPLNQEYEERLEERFDAYAVTVSSGTSGLTAALMASLPFNPKTRRMVGVPAWTFCATANAVFSAGFRPLIMDVDDEGVLDPSYAGGCDALVVVAPLGAPLDLKQWDEFSVLYDTPVVIDAAAGFDSVKDVGMSPVVVSTHCTKVFSSGEGGFVLSQDKDIIDKIRRISNQGMLPDKTISELGMNAKLSEYHAAVGLAELDRWEEKRKKWEEIQDWYLHTSDYVCSTQGIFLNDSARCVVDRLLERGIQARESWYGIHGQEVFTKIWFDGMDSDGKIHMPFDKSEELRSRTIFLPKFIGMTKENVDYIMESLCASQ